MPSIYPVASGRVSERLLQVRLQSQFDFDRSELVRLQDQLSTLFAYVDSICFFLLLPDR